MQKRKDKNDPSSQFLGLGCFCFLLKEHEGDHHVFQFLLMIIVFKKIARI